MLVFFAADLGLLVAPDQLPHALQVPDGADGKPLGFYFLGSSNRPSAYSKCLFGPSESWFDDGPAPVQCVLVPDFFAFVAVMADGEMIQWYIKAPLLLFCAKLVNGAIAAHRAPCIAPINDSPVGNFTCEI